MVYLSDVEEGGYTVFPRMNLGIKPKKGSAIYWRNLQSDGSKLTDTLHGGCPVLHGEKWAVSILSIFASFLFLPLCDILLKKADFTFMICRQIIGCGMDPVVDFQEVLSIRSSREKRRI